MDKEEIVLQKHLKDLAERSYQNNMFTFSGFLSLPQQDLLYSMQSELSYVPFSLFGGNDCCERKMVRFGAKEILGYNEEYPIMCVKVMPLIEKFADEFTHRDFLGAIMNLGIERSTIGDIILDGKKAYVFCMNQIASFMMEQLEQVKHTHMKCEIVLDDIAFSGKEPVEKEIIVTSVRIDVIISKLYNISRNQSLQLFSAKKVFVNGRSQESNSYMLKESESVTVRGYGKFDYLGIRYATKKEKICIAILQYV